MSEKKVLLLSSFPRIPFKGAEKAAVTAAENLSVIVSRCVFSLAKSVERSFEKRGKKKKFRVLYNQK